MNIKKFLICCSLLITTMYTSTIKINAEENYNNNFNFFNTNSIYLKNYYIPTDIHETIQNTYNFESSEYLPEQLDLSKTNYFPPIGNQIGGSCASWSTTYYQLTYEMNKLNKTSANIPQNICSPLYTFNYLNDGNISQGAHITKCYETIQNLGCTTCDILDPKNNTSTKWLTDPKILTDNLKYNINYKSFQLDSNNPEYNKIKTILNENKLVVTSGFVNLWNFNTVSELKDNNIIQTNEKIITETYYNTQVTSKNNGPHAFTIVGYDDNIWCDVNNNDIKDNGEVGAFKIANSWSDGWANNGFIWILYDAFNLESNIPNKPNNEKYTRIPISCMSEKDTKEYFYYIDISKNKPMLIGEINLNTDYRNQIIIQKGIANIKEQEATTFHNYIKINCTDDEKINQLFKKPLKFTGSIIVDFDKEYNYFNVSAYNKFFWNVKITDAFLDNNYINNITYTLKDNLGNPITETITLQAVDGNSIIGKVTSSPTCRGGGFLSL